MQLLKESFNSWLAKVYAFQFSKYFTVGQGMTVTAVYYCWVYVFLIPNQFVGRRALLDFSSCEETQMLTRHAEKNCGSFRNGEDTQKYSVNI